MDTYERMAAPQVGDAVPYHLRPGFVVLSFVFSLIGDITFMELLHRQQKAHGWRYWVQLTSTALPLGLVGIWTMHFVGNAAIILADGSMELQPVYNPGYSFLSALLPVATIVGMLFVADKRHLGSVAKVASLTSAGILAGLAIVGMHYVGNLGMSNYDFHMSDATFAGAIAIGCAAMTAVLFGIAWLQDVLLNTRFWRVCCSLVIAGTVSGLHFEASQLVTYKFRYLNTSGTAARYQNIIVSAILLVLTIASCALLAVYTTRERREIRRKAEQVVLSCAWFDLEGRIMVTRTGLLPTVSITDKDSDRGFQDDFDTGHPAFQWLFKVTQDWTSVSRFVTGMKARTGATTATGMHLGGEDTNQEPRSTAAADKEYSLLFRQRFCTGALELAETLRISLNEIGSLFEGVVNYSTLTHGSSPRKPLSIGNFCNRKSPKVDLEACNSDFGKGQGLFLTKRIDRRDIAKYQSMGYRFSELGRVAAPMASAMQITTEQAHEYLSNICQQTAQREKQHAGTYLSLFALCPEVGECHSTYGPKIVVQETEHHRMPSIYLWNQDNHDTYHAWASEWQGLSCADILALTAGQARRDDEDYANFCRIFRRAIHELGVMINANFLEAATLYTSPVKVLSEIDDGHKAYNNTLSFCVIPDIHSSLKWSTGVKLIPYSFFRCLQQAQDRACDPAFVAKVHTEFGLYCDDESSTTEPKSPFAQSMSRISSLISPRSSTRRLLSSERSGPSTRRSDLTLESVPESGTSMVRLPEPKKQIRTTRAAGYGEGFFNAGPFGGVLVMRSVSVDPSPRRNEDLVSPVSTAGSVPSSTRDSLAQKGEANSQLVEARVWVDELYEVTTKRWAAR